jgi:hypothetical protein
MCRLDPVPRARIAVVQDAAQHGGRAGEYFLRLLSGGIAVADPALFLEFDGFDEVFVLAQLIPGGVSEGFSREVRCFLPRLSERKRGAVRRQCQ